MNRTFEVGLTAWAIPTAVTATGAVVSDTPAPAEAETEEAHKLEAAGFKLDWERLSDGGAWLLRVYVGDELVDIAAHDDPETVLLAVADRLLPGSH